MRETFQCEIHHVFPKHVETEITNVETGSNIGGLDMLIKCCVFILQMGQSILSVCVIYNTCTCTYIILLDLIVNELKVIHWDAF